MSSYIIYTSIWGGIYHQLHHFLIQIVDICIIIVWEWVTYKIILIKLLYKSCIGYHYYYLNLFQDISPKRYIHMSMTIVAVKDTAIMYRVCPVTNAPWFLLGLTITPVHHQGIWTKAQHLNIQNIYKRKHTNFDNQQ